MDFRRFLQIPMLEMTEYLKNMQDGMHPRNGIWRRTAENLQKYVLFLTEDLHFCKMPKRGMQLQKCRMNCRKTFLQFMNNGALCAK